NYLNYNAPRYTSGRKYELGTLNTIGTFGMLASMRMTEAIGLDQIWRHVLELTDHAIARLAPLGYRPFAPRGISASGIVSFVPPAGTGAEDLSATVRRLERDHRICVTARSGRLRISPHLYNTLAEVDQLADAFRPGA
ncbi:MAG TPA: aminotransferase class V-fold PLP-dependent enzyme, partial [Planctomycetota bacterium]|nr:aminotransferase class V-fold PLP-dependent enzyme [Planctomycetota bacterium]